MQTVTIIRDGQIKMTLPVEVHSDGSIWARSSAGMQPVVSEAKMLAAGYTKQQMAKWIKAGQLTEAAACALHMGANPGGTEVLTPAEADVRLAPQRAAEEEARKYTRKIHLSGRGWGDYSPVEWCGDLRRSDAEILSECRAILDRSNDLDEPQTDEQILAKIAQARAGLAADQAESQAAIDRIAALQATARETGKPQVVRCWQTNRCMNHSCDCSFDSAVETIDGDGNRKTTYTCCFCGRDYHGIVHYHLELRSHVRKAIVRPRQRPRELRRVGIPARHLSCLLRHRAGPPAEGRDRIG